MPTKTQLNEKERLDIAFWLSDKYDRMRETISQRASIVVSADALLIASATFLLDKIFSGGNNYPEPERKIMAICSGIALLLLTLSIVFAANGIVNLWTTSRKLFGRNMKPSIFFHAFHTKEVFKDLTHFEKEFRKATTDELLTYALGNLWLMENLFVYRYDFLSRAIKLLLASIFPLLVSIGILILRAL